MSMIGAEAEAHDFEVANSDGVTIYYKKMSATTVAVSYKGRLNTSFYNEYTGNVVIPNSVTYDGSTYTVIAIVGAAFYECSGLTSVTIPNSVTTIDRDGGDLFYGCSSLVTIKVASGNTKYDSRNNCNAIIETASNTLVAGCKAYYTQQREEYWFLCILWSYWSDFHKHTE